MLCFRKVRETGDACGKPAEVEQKKHLPRISVIIFIVTAVCLLIYGVCLLSPQFSDFFNRYFSSVIRAILAWLTGWIPFSPPIPPA